MMASVEIEQLAKRPELLPMVARWIYEQWWKDVENASVADVVELLQAHLVPEQIPLTSVALQESLPVGTATLLAHDVGTERWPQLSPWMAAVYVLPEFRRQGIGAALVNATVAQAGVMGTRELYLLTVDREAFYARLGWAVLDKAEGRTVMSRTLQNPKGSTAVP